ncbi:NADPH-dependent FMN reductase [Kitasatospora kifunensis]|uniref:NAD(P)H-dependent FMN reductase n=1 Tax=Kitasatospora kifunensis TaxID=58351 RepID=A0A7W7VTB9_KITKI|nr:NAD(P)H-dependent oxidoreductase [Kitasatospora kifunensis]MBB4922062.1 NAD(P)H-dependent FMN reductase [Kitasatospora kifunensis]
MSTAPLNLVVIVGSTREGRFAPTVASWFAEQARAHDDVTVDVIDLAEADLPHVLSGEPTPAVAAVTPRLAAADAFVVITPEYNHSYPASLKAAIDWHYAQWQAKPVGFVSYGGVSGGLRAVEHLRQVFAELHAMTVRDTVSFHLAWERFDADGQPHDAHVVNGAAKKMLDQLGWWGRALREARNTAPYTA